MHIRSCVTYGYFDATVAELSSGDRDQKKFIDPWIDSYY